MEDGKRMRHEKSPIRKSTGTGGTKMAPAESPHQGEGEQRVGGAAFLRERAARQPANQAKFDVNNKKKLWNKMAKIKAQIRENTGKASGHYPMFNGNMEGRASRRDRRCWCSRSTTARCRSDKISKTYSTKKLSTNERSSEYRSAINSDGDDAHHDGGSQPADSLLPSRSLSLSSSLPSSVTR